MTKKQSHRQKGRSNLRRKLRLLGLALLVVLGTAITFVTLYCFRFLNQSFVRAEGYSSPLVGWGGDTPANFLWQVSSDGSSDNGIEILVLHLDPHRPESVLLTIDPRPCEGNSSSGACVQEVSRKLAIPIHGYFEIPDRVFPELRSFLSGEGNLTRFSLFFSSIIGGDLLTNLPLRDIWRIVWFIQSLRPSQFTLIDRRTGGFAEWRDITADDRIEDEGARVVVLNGTVIPGLAGDGARWVRNLGGFVLDVGNAPETSYEHSIILADDPGSYTATRLSHELDIPDLRRKDESLEWGRRSNIVVILGLDKESGF